MIRFSHLRLPDHTEIAFSGLALDGEENKPGLAPSRRIQGAQPAQPSTGAQVAKNAGSQVLGLIPGNDLVSVAKGAGQTAINANHVESGMSRDALLLDAGSSLDIFVLEKF
jgi:hypothetical protein